jgi:hypothetical protein
LRQSQLERCETFKREETFESRSKALIALQNPPFLFLLYIASYSRRRRRRNQSYACIYVSSGNTFLVPDSQSLLEEYERFCDLCLASLLSN